MILAVNKIHEEKTSYSQQAGFNVTVDMSVILTNRKGTTYLVRDKFSFPQHDWKAIKEQGYFESEYDF